MTNKNKLIVYLISFIIVWLLYVFYLEKNDFDIEFREKGVTTATVFGFDSEEILEELYDGRKTNVYEVEYVEYSYVVNGEKYKYGSKKLGKEFSIGEEIQIEYVSSNPEVSRIKGMKIYAYNFFVRNLIMVSILALLLMIGIFYSVDYIVGLKQNYALKKKK